MIVEIQKHGANPLVKLEQGVWYKAYTSGEYEKYPMHFMFKRWNTLEEIEGDAGVISKNKGFAAGGDWSEEGIFVNKKNRSDKVFPTTKEEILEVAMKHLEKSGYGEGCSYLTTKGYPKTALEELQPCIHNGVLMGIGFGKLDTLVFDYNKAAIGKLITPKK